MCWRTVEANVRASVSSRQAPPATSRPSGSRIDTLHSIPWLFPWLLRTSTEKRFPASTSGAEVTISPVRGGAVEPLEVPADLPEHRLDVEHEVRLHVGQLLERVLQRVAGSLGIGERVHQHHG